MQSWEKQTYVLVILTLVIILVLGLISQGVMESLEGFLRIQRVPARLLNDFTVHGGIGGAFVNAALMGGLALLLIRFTGVRLSGPTFAGIFTIVGFSLFGKTPVNSLPIVLGVYLAARYIGKPFKNYLLMALFGTAAGPIISFVMVELGFSGVLGVVLGITAGIGVGFILPSAAMAMLRMHEGYNLYNIGLTVGFLSLFAASLSRALGATMSTDLVWNTDSHPVLHFSTLGIGMLFILWGVIKDRQKLRPNLRRIYRQSGRLPSDLMDDGSGGAALVNAGVLGVVSSLYLLLVGADLNGPTLGAVFTVIGFGTFGKHLRNILPVMVGVVAATLIFGKPLNAPGPVLAVLFATTLAPLSGEFGPLVGFAAGMTHLFMVEQTGAWHGGMNLYNNGFAGGLTATLFVAVIQWVRANKT